MAFPVKKNQVLELVHEHRSLNDEKPVLAVYFASESAPNDECLFEVIKGFGFSEVSEDRDIMQVAFASTADFPLPDGVKMRIWATSPEECREAISEDWPDVRDLKAAIARGQAELLLLDRNDSDAVSLAESLKFPVAA